MNERSERIGSTPLFCVFDRRHPMHDPYQVDLIVFGKSKNTPPETKNGDGEDGREVTGIK